MKMIQKPTFFKFERIRIEKKLGMFRLKATISGVPKFQVKQDPAKNNSFGRKESRWKNCHSNRQAKRRRASSEMGTDEAFEFVELAEKIMTTPRTLCKEPQRDTAVPSLNEINMMTNTVRGTTKTKKSIATQTGEIVAVIVERLWVRRESDVLVRESATGNTAPEHHILLHDVSPEYEPCPDQYRRG